MDTLVDTQSTETTELKNSSKIRGNHGTTLPRLGNQTSHGRTQRSKFEPQEMKTIMRTFLPYVTSFLGKSRHWIVPFLLLTFGINLGAFSQFTPGAPEGISWNSNDANSVFIGALTPPSFGPRDGYIVSINTVNSFTNRTGTAPPTSGSLAYSGSGEQVVYVGAGTNISSTITGLSPGTTYYISAVTYFDQFNTGIPTYSPDAIKAIYSCGLTPTPITEMTFTPSTSGITISSMTAPDYDFTGYLVKMNTVNSFTSPAAIETTLPTANTVYSGSGEQVVYVGGSSAPGITVTNIGGANPQQYFFKVFRYTANCTTGDRYFETGGFVTSDYTCRTSAPPNGTNGNLFFSGGSIDSYSLTPAYDRAAGHDLGVLVYINTENTFTDPEATISGLPTVNSVYSGSGQQLVSLGGYGTIFTNNFISTVTNLIPNTTYYFKSYSFDHCGGNTLVNTSDTQTLALTTCNISDHLASGASFGAITDNSMELSSFSALTPRAPSTAPDGYIIRMNDVNSFSTYANGTVLPTGDPAYAGTGEQVIYAGNSTSPNLNITGLTANSTYYFNIVAYYPACGVPAQVRYQQTGYNFSKSNSTASEPTITFGDLYKSVGSANFNLTATASDASTVSYQLVSQTGLGTSLSGTNNETVTLGTAGTVVIEASANGATAQATLTITELATSETYFASGTELIKLEEGAATSLATLSGAYGTTAVGFGVLEGAIWVATVSGGANNSGVFTRLNLDGTSPVTLDLPTASATSTWAATSSAGGKIWMTRNAGGVGSGEVFVADPDGSNMALVHTFDGTGLTAPFAEIVEFGGVFYGACSSDATNSAGGIFSLTPDGMGGYTYAVEHTFTSADNNRRPFGGMTIHDNLIWYTNEQNFAVAYNPTTNTFPHAVSVTNFPYNALSINNELYIVDDLALHKTSAPYSGSTKVLTFANGSNWGDISYDGEFIYGIFRASVGGTGQIWRVRPDGTGFEIVYTNPSAGVLYVSKAVNGVTKATTGVAFEPPTTVLQGNSVTLESQTNSSGAVTYELVGDVTGSTLVGNLFTAGNAGSVTVRVSVAEDNNFNAITKDVTITIPKNDPTFVIADLELGFGSGAYTFAPATVTYDGTVSYAFVDGGSLVATGPNTSSTISGNTMTPINQGTETIRATLPETANYNGTTVDFNLNVVAGTADLTGFANFSRELFSADTVLEISTAPGIGVIYELLTSNTGTTLVSGNTLQVGNVAGTETLRVTVNQANYNATVKDITFTVAKLTPVITWAAPADIQFGIAPLTTTQLNASSSVAGMFTYEYLDGSYQSITAGTTVLPDVATYTLRANFVPNDQTNYQNTSATTSINATKIDLEITADDKLWKTSASEPALTYTITKGAIAPGNNSFIPLTRGTSNALGSYPIVINTALTAPFTDPDEFLVCSPGLCIVEDGGLFQGDVVIQTTKYNVTFVPGTFTITDKTVLTAADLVLNAPAGLVYDATAKSYSLTINGALSPALPSSDVEITYEGRNGTVYANSTTAPTNAGDYTVTAAVLASNVDYAGSNSIDFSITPLSTTIDLNLPGSNLVYTGTAQGISPFANDLNSNPTLSLVTEYREQTAGSFSQTVPVGAGIYDVRVNLATSEVNYTASEATGVYTIDKASQSITFNPIPDVQCGQTTIDLSQYASSSSGYTVTFASDNLAVATISGNTATIVGVGSATITASQSGDANIAAAVDQTQPLTIAAMQENFSVDNPANVQVCDGGPYLLPALTSGNYFSGPGGTGTAYAAGAPIASNTTLYVYGVSSVNGVCTDENSFTITIENLPIDQPTDVTATGNYTLPALTNGSYFTASGGGGSTLNAGDVISTNQTIYVYNSDAMTGCTREVAFNVTIIPNPALHFSGDTGNTYDYLEVPDDNTLDLTTAMTFEAWVNFDQVTRQNNGYDWHMLLGKSTFNASYGLMLLSDASVGGPYLGLWHTGVGDGFTISNTASWTPSANTWYHVAVTIDGTNGTNIYVDGVNVGSESGTGTLPTNTGPLRIGANPPAGNTTNPYPLQGAIDEVRLWNTIRTPAEINANKDMQLQGNESGLVLYYNFDEGAVAGDNTGLTQVTDRSGNNNHASFNSFALTGSTSNYVDGSANGVIAGLPQSITFNPLSNVTFGDANFDLTATASSNLVVTYVSSNPSVATVSGSTVTIVGAGNTTFTAIQAGDVSYLPASNVDQALTVDRFSTSINLNLPGTNPTYNGVGQGITPTANDASGNPTLTLVTEYSPQGAGTFSTTLPVGVGTYDVRVNLDASETNYTATETTGKFTIDKAPLTARLDDASIVYGTIGANNHPVTYTGFVNGETETVLTVNTGWPTVLLLDFANSGALYNVGGPYTGGITWSSNPELNITANNYTITFEAGDITSVTPRPINIQPDNRSIVYGEDPEIGNVVTFEAYNEAGMRGLANGESAADFTGTILYDNISTVNVGVYADAIAPLSGLTNANYAISYGTADLTITRKDLNVTADNRTITYGDDANSGNTVSYSGFIPGEDETDLGGVLDFELISQVNVGTYTEAISAEGLTSTNYNLIYNNGDLTISQRAITVTADAQTKAFGDADPTLTYQITSGALQFSDALTGALSRATGEDLGTYAINQGTVSAGSNYAFTYVLGDFTITKADQVISFSAIPTKNLGDPVFALNAGGGGSGNAVTYSSSNTDVATVSGNMVTVVGVGTSTITASQLGDANHNDATPVDQVLNVNHGTYERYFVKVHSIYGMTASNQTALVKTFNTSEGQNIETLVKVKDQIWGSTTQGGANSKGTLFRMDADGNNFEKLHDFTAGEGSPRNDLINVADTAVYGTAGNYGIFRASVTNPAANVDFYNGYSGSNQFTTSLSFYGDQLWAIDNEETMVAVAIDFSGFETGIPVFGASPFAPAFDFVTEGYWMASVASFPTTTSRATFPYYRPGFETIQNSLWQSMSGGLPHWISTSGAEQNKINMLYDNGLFIHASEAGSEGSFGLATFIADGINYTLSITSAFRDNIVAFNTDIAGNSIASLSERYLNLYDVKDSVVWGVRGDAANGLYEAFSYDLHTQTYQSHDFGAGNLAAGVPNAAFFSFRKEATIVTNDQTKVYGTANPTLTYDIWGLDASDNESTLGFVAPVGRILRGGRNYEVVEVDNNTHPGVYPIVATADTLNGKYDLSHKFGMLTVTHEIQSSDIVFAPATSTFEYNGVSRSFTAVGKAGTPAGVSGLFIDATGSSLAATDFDYTYSASTDGGTTYTVDLGTTAPSDAGKYRVTATVKSTNNVYSGSASVDFEITPTPITITADAIAKTYGDVDPTLTYQVTSGALLAGDVLSGALTRVAGEGVGTYTISQGTLDNANYAITFVSDNLTIGARAITVTADAQSKTYGDVDPTLTYQVTSGALQGSDVLIGDLSRVTGEDVGTYAINQGTVDNSNYTITYVPADLTIGTREITVTADAKSKTYGDADPAFTYQVTTGALQGSDVLSGDLTRVAGEGVGTYAINQGTLDNANYNITYVSADLTIGARAITVTSLPSSKSYGDPDPATFPFFITLGSLVSGDALSGVLSRDPGENVGTYAINQGTLDNSNYDITFVSGNLSILPRALVVTADAQSKTYGDVDPDLTYQVTFGMLQGSDVLTGSLAREAGEDVGTYAINGGTLSAGANYVLSYVAADLTITQRAITVTADAQSKTYGDVDPTLTYQVTSGALQGSDVLSGTLTRVAGEDVGTYAINQGTVDNINYAITYVTADLTIGTRAITVTADAKSKVYGEGDPALTYQVTTGALQGSDVLSGNLERVTGEDVGTYAINQGTVDNSNYAITYVPADLTIGTRAITVTADAISKTYGDADPVFTYQVTSGALQGSDAFTGVLDRAVGENVGTYAISQGTLETSANYNLTFIGNDLTIGNRAITVTADAKNKIYGEADPALTYQVTAGALQGADVLSGALTRVAGEGVGTYVINQGTLDNTNYAITYLSDNISITPRAIGITADDQSKVLGAADPTLTYTILSGMLVNGDMLSGSLTRAAGETVGDYAIQQGTLDAGGNYNIAFTNGTLTITDKIPQTITFNSLSPVLYGGADFDLSAMGGASGNPVTFVSSDLSVATISGNTVTIVGAGTATITASQAGDATYAAAADVNQSLTVIPAILSVQAETGQTKIYGEADPVFTYQITGGSLVGSDVLTGSLARVAGENVGTYAIEQGTLDNPNYNIIFSGNDFEITKRSITVTADNQTRVYGDADPALTYQVTSGALQFSDALTGSLTREVGEPQGLYAINQGTLAASSNYDMTFVAGEFRIDYRFIRVTVGTISKTYGEADPAFDMPFTIIEGSLAFDDALNLTGSFRDAGENVGGYRVKGLDLVFTSTNGGSYSWSIFGAGSALLNITPRAIEVTADAKTKTYGESDPELTYQITSGALQFTDELTGSLERVTGENAGTYAINQGTLTAGSNYNLSYVSNDLTIGPIALAIKADNKTKVQGTPNPTFTYTITSGALINGDQITGALSVPVSAISVGVYPISQGTLTAGANYNISFTSGDFTITNLQLQTIAFGALTPVTYGDAVFMLNAMGGMSGNPVTFSGDNPAVATVSSSGEVTIVGAGTVNITANQAGNATYAAADPVVQALKVNKATLTITAEDKSSTYGDASLPSLTASYSGFVNGEDESILTTPVNLSTVALVGSNANTYPIIASGATAANYQIMHLFGALTINPAALTITADDKSNTYGDVVPALTVNYSGFVNGETASVLTTAPAVSTNATSTSDAGTYAITVSGAVASNYSITETNGTLTIGKANLSVTADDQSKTYGAANPSFGLSYSGFIGSDDASVLDTAPSSGSTADATSTVGTYAITASGGVDNNYTFSYTDGTLTVNQATLTVTADDQSKTYGDANPGLTLTYSGFQNGEDASSLTTEPTATTSATSTSSVGTYAITASGGAANNYVFSYTEGTLTVNQATLTVTANDQEVTYGDAIPTLSLTYAGFVGGDDETVLDTAPTASTNATTTSDAGAYSITASGGADNNYGFAYTEGTLTINKADQAITFDALADRAVGDAAFDLTATTTSGLTITYTSSDETVATVSGSTVTILNAGTTTIMASQSGDTNFNAATAVEQTLTVNTNIQDQTITFEALSNQTYGASPVELAATASSGLTVTYTSSDAAVATVSGNTVTIHSVGTTTITASQAGNDSFTAAPDVTQTLTIDPAALTVTADDQTKVYGEANPTLTLTYVGFVNGEDATVLDTTPTVATSADAGSEAGTYEISVAGGSASNYVITPATGTMTITKATLVATADDQVMRTGDAVPDLTISYSGFVNGDTEADIDIAPAISTAATSASPSGLYDILMTGGEDNNYDLTLINGTLTIETVLGLVLEQSQIMIYPNPVVDKLYIDFPQSLSGEVIQVQLFDLEGRKLQSKEVQGYGVELDVRDLPSGLVILQMSANGEVIRKRVKKD